MVVTNLAFQKDAPSQAFIAFSLVDLNYFGTKKHREKGTNADQKSWIFQYKTTLVGPKMTIVQISAIIGPSLVAQNWTRVPIQSVYRGSKTFSYRGLDWRSRT